MEDLMPNQDPHARLYREVDAHRDELVKWTSELVQIPTEVPLSDTRAAADYAAAILAACEGSTVTQHCQEEPVRNLVAVLKGTGRGTPRRLVFNGHLDTYPAGDHAGWAENPFSGAVRDGKIHGRGAADMKGGIASAMLTYKLLSQCRESWFGELVLTLAGDEENMGERGTKFLLDTVPAAMGDAMICPDVGVANVLRFGQKGMYWIELRAEGKAGHGAHVHRGINAIDRLVEGIRRINSELAALPVNAPPEVTQAILAAAEVSEPLAGKGETDVLQRVTVNFGVIEGGLTPNLIPASASAKADIRIPVGVSLEQVADTVRGIVDSIEGLSYTPLRAYQPNHSPLDAPIFGIVKANVERVLQTKTVITMRVGASDARLYRLVKGVPSINCGLTPYNLGAPNEYADLEEMVRLAKIHVGAAFDFLNQDEHR